jgi:hypothetical protein
VCIGDLPNITRLEQVANQCKIDELKQVFDEAIEEWGDHANFGYNPQLKYKEQFLTRRLEYITEVLRQMAMIRPNVVAVVDHDLLPLIED